MSSMRALGWWIVVGAVCAVRAPAPAGEPTTVRERLWIWGHPAGVYNDSYLRPLEVTSSIEPVDAARYMGIVNVIFVRDRGVPSPPFDDYYRPFREMDRVYWSLVAAGGRTSQRERDAAFSGDSEDPVTATSAGSMTSDGLTGASLLG